MSTIERFAEAIEEETKEVRRKSRAARFDVFSGRRYEDDGSTVAYAFDCASSTRLKEDAAIILIMPDGERLTGTVLQHKGSEIRVSLERDAGDKVPAAQMMTDDTFLLMKMKEAVEDAIAGKREMNEAFAMAAIGEGPVKAGEVPAETKSLNDDQGRAVRVSLGSDVSFLWGPPGTGKTATMSRLVQEMLRRGLSVLIVSNANLAVDTLLERVCADLAKAGGLKPGQIVRYGTPVRESMVHAFGDAIIPARVFERENPGFESGMRDAEARIAALMRRRQGTAAKASALPEIDRRKEALRRAERALAMASAEVTGVNQRLVKKELQMAGWKAKLDKGGDRSLLAMIEEAQNDAIDLEEARDALLPGVEAAKAEAAAARERVEELSSAASGSVMDEWEGLQKELDDAQSAVRKGHERKAGYAKILAQNAQVVAATAYQAYLTTLKKGGFDAVVVDEASMLPLPLLWLVAGLANKHVVIAGDFKQLPTVAISELPVVKEYYAKDPFVKAGIAAKAERGGLPPHAVALRTQYRMRKDICELINKPFYGGILKTPEGQHEGPPERGVFASSTLSILDFRGFNPWGMRKASGSRLNPMQSVGLGAVSAILRKSKEWSADAGDFGAITAYAAQAEAINDCLREIGGFHANPAATIHKFQGSEKDTILFEVTDGRGIGLGGFFKGTSDGIDQRLLNVAFSRARKRVVLVGNVEYLDQFASAGSAFAGLLSTFKSRARKVDAAATLVEHGAAVGCFAAAPAAARQAMIRDVGAAKQRIEAFFGGWRLKEVLHISTVLDAKLAAGVRVSLRIEQGALQAMAQESRLEAALASLAAKGMTIDAGGFSGQESGLLVDRKRLWLIPAGGFGVSSEKSPFMAVDAPQFGPRLVAALHEGVQAWHPKGRKAA